MKILQKQSYKRQLVQIWIAPIAFLLLFADVHGEVAEVTGFSGIAARQQTPVWCWAAGMQMVFNRAGVGWSQKQVVDSVKHRIAFETASPDEITRGLRGWRVQNNGQSWTVDCLYQKGMPVASMMIRHLKDNRPLIVGVNNQHVVVIYKAEFTPTATEPTIHNVTIYDPWDGTDKPLPWPATMLSDTWYVMAVLERQRIF